MSKGEIPGGLRWPVRSHVSVLHRPSCVRVGIPVRCEVGAQGGQMSIRFNHVLGGGGNAIMPLPDRVN